MSTADGKTNGFMSGGNPPRPLPKLSAPVSDQYPQFSNLCISSFRKNFAQQMEYLGVEPEHFDAHQGRYESALRKKHYLRDKMRAVRLMREHVDKLFGGDDTPPKLQVINE